MIPPTTYFAFHALFVLPPIALLASLTWVRRRRVDGAVALTGLGILVILAVVYTTPWGNILVERGVWWYGDGVVWRRLGVVPVGEYLFFVLQPILTVLFLLHLDLPTGTDLRLSWRARAIGALGGLLIGVAGIGLLAFDDATTYLGAILAWAGPILAIQWGFGWTHLWRARRTVCVGVAVPTLYLWFADRIAISIGLWTISDAYTLGIAPFGLPIEEASFFLLTNVFLVQGFVLYAWVFDQCCRSS